MAHPTIKIFSLLFALSLCCPSQAKAYRFLLSEGKSQIEFEGTGKPSMLKIHGSSDEKLDGYFIFDGKKLSGKVAFNLNGLDTGIELRNDHMKNRYLEVGKFPKAELEIKDLNLNRDFNPKSFKVAGPFRGVLQLHGVSHPVSGKIDLKAEGDELKIDCEYSLSIVDFKIQRPSYANISMTDEVKINAKATAKLVGTP